MRVCLLTRYFDFRNAGLGRVSREVMAGLVRKGHSVYTISTNGNSLYSYFSYTMFELPFRVPRKDIDIYHALTPMEGMWLPKDRSIITINDLILIMNPEMVSTGLSKSKLRLFLGRKYFEVASRVATRAKFVVCISEKTKKDVVETLRIREDKIRVIRLGISEDLRPWGKNNTVFRVGYLGQLDRRKRVGLLIKAFAESSLDAELVIGGIGADEGRLKELAGRDKRIKLLGLVPDGDLVNFYNSLDVFVFPSVIEGYGLPIVEAMACKKPVVVLSDAIIPWEVKSRCIIAENLDLLFENKSHFEGLCRGVDYEGNYTWAKAHSWDKCVDEYIKLYEEVIG